VAGCSEGLASEACDCDCESGLQVGGWVDDIVPSLLHEKIKGYADKVGGRDTKKNILRVTGGSGEEVRRDE
jgi:hypothetical protein